MSTFHTIMILAAIVVLVGMTGCGAMHSTNTRAGKARGTVPLSSASTPNTEYLGVMPTQSVETHGVTTLSNMPQTVIGIPGGPTYTSPKDIDAEGVEVTTAAGTFKADRFVAKTSTPMLALAVQLDHLGDWISELADAQQARDEARAKAASEAIGKSVEALTKLYVP